MVLLAKKKKSTWNNFLNLQKREQKNVFKALVYLIALDIIHLAWTWRWLSCFISKNLLNASRLQNFFSFLTLLYIRSVSLYLLDEFKFTHDFYFAQEKQKNYFFSSCWLLFLLFLFFFSLSYSNNVFGMALVE